MAGQIGIFTFLTLKGGVALGSGLVLEEITRPNVDGVAYRKSGKRGQPFQMASRVDLANAADAKSNIQNYIALEGTLQTLIEENGNTWTNVMILSVRHISSDPIRSAVGGISGASPSVLLSMSWTLQMMETV